MEIYVGRLEKNQAIESHSGEFLPLKEKKTLGLTKDSRYFRYLFKFNREKEYNIFLTDENEVIPDITKIEISIIGKDSLERVEIINQNYKKFRYSIAQFPKDLVSKIINQNTLLGILEFKFGYSNGEFKTMTFEIKFIVSEHLFKSQSYKERIRNKEKKGNKKKIISNLLTLSKIRAKSESDSNSISEKIQEQLLPQNTIKIAQKGSILKPTPIRKKESIILFQSPVPLKKDYTLNSNLTITQNSKKRILPKDFFGREREIKIKIKKIATSNNNGEEIKF
jgi:hypothetical protein